MAAPSIARSRATVTRGIVATSDEMRAARGYNRQPVSRAFPVFAVAVVGVGVGCATADAPPYYYGDAAVDGISGSGAGASGGSSGSAAAGGSSGSGGASSGGTGGSATGGNGGGCSIAQCPNDGNGVPCCLSASGPCGMDRGSGCVATSGSGGSSAGGVGGAGVGGAGGGFPCLNCQGTCKSLNDDSACFVDCIANQNKSDCYFENDVCTCIP
jgi:hypothetical protein